MFEKNAQASLCNKPAPEAGHRCITCLTGHDADKRACAMRQMLAEGYSARQLASLRAAPNHSH